MSEPYDGVPGRSSPSWQSSPDPSRRARVLGAAPRAAARALDDDWPQVLAALRRGLEERDAGKAARTAVAYVQLVYGCQLQQQADEMPPAVEALDVSRMTIAERESLKCRIPARHPHLVEEILGDDS